MTKQIHIMTEEHKKKIGDALRGRKMPQEIKDKIKQTTKGRTFSEEHRKHISESKMGHYVSDETKKKISQILTGRKLSEEHVSKIISSLKGKKRTMEQRKNISFGHKGRKNPKLSIALKGRVLTPEWREKIKNSLTGRKLSEECKLKMKKSHQEHPVHYTIERRRKMSELMKGRKFSEERKEKMRKTTKDLYKKGLMLGFKKTRYRIIIPKKDTKIEVKIQNYLKQLNYNFIPHYYVNITHGYQCDMFIPSKNLVIECDGDYWHNYPIGREIDRIRTQEMIEKGYRVLRLWENEIQKMDINTLKNIVEVNEKCQMQ